MPTIDNVRRGCTYWLSHWLTPIWRWRRKRHRAARGYLTATIHGRPETTQPVTTHPVASQPVTPPLVTARPVRSQATPTPRQTSAGSSAGSSPELTAATEAQLLQELADVKRALRTLTDEVQRWREDTSDAVRTVHIHRVEHFEVEQMNHTIGHLAVDQLDGTLNVGFSRNLRLAPKPARPTPAPKVSVGPVRQPHVVPSTGPAQASGTESPGQ